MAKPAPIKFSFKKKRLPFNPHLFFRVIQDVNSYPQFINNMPSCHADPATKYEKQTSPYTITGGFTAPTRIGFNAISFEYTSKIEYRHPTLPVNLLRDRRALLWRVTTRSREGSRIFNSLNSEWVIRLDPSSDKRNQCLVDYQIEMEFASSLYSAVTSQFFDLLASNIDRQFAARCKEISRKGMYADEYTYERVEGAKEDSKATEPPARGDKLEEKMKKK